MSEPGTKFELSRDIERYLAALSKLYKRDQKTERLEVIVNAQVRVHEQWDSDNWNGGTYGHALYLTLPEDVYLGLIEDRDTLQDSIRSDINKLHNVQDEHIAQIFIEMQTSGDYDWRHESGALHAARRTVVPDAAKRIWGEYGYRVFLSHKSEVKKEAAQVSDDLKLFGVSAFVAHENIRPTKAWQDEIENALASMDAFVALLTSKFHDSEWTDQEVGYAMGQGVPLICVKLEQDPYGFIGKFQALSCDWESAPVALANLLIRQPRMLDAYITGLHECSSFAQGITLSKVFPQIESLTTEQGDAMMAAFNKNPDLRGSWGFNGAYSSMYGNGLAPHLSRVTGHNYVMTRSGEMERKN